MKRRLSKVVQRINDPEEQSIGNIHTREQSTKVWKIQKTPSEMIKVIT